MQYFGTDGIRGIVGLDILPHDAFRLGYAVAKLFYKMGKNNLILLAKDTRNSSDLLLSAISSGINFAGVDIVNVGTLPSPAVSYLTKKYSASAGICVTGSHNLPNFNGFMIYDFNGYKISKRYQCLLEKKLLNCSFEVDTFKFGSVLFQEKSKFDYLAFLKDAVNSDLSGLNIRLDLCFGSACFVAVDAFEGSGAHVIADNSFADSDRVNVGCGTQDISRFAGAVVRNHHDVGFAFDGDADRVLAIDEKGKLVDGDKILFLLAKHFYFCDRLYKNTVVGTQLSSLALEKALLANNINFIRTDIGEQSIVSCMKNHGFILGAENVGKVIMRDYLPTADGILSALFVAKIMKLNNAKLSELVKDVKDLPCAKKSYTMSLDKIAQLKNSSKFNDFLDRIKQHEKSARIIVRASGTENVIRVFIEASTKKQLKTILNNIEQFILHF